MSIMPRLQASFPPDFVWGVATSAFQIEGASTADGRGPSIWDTFCQRPGAIADGSNGNTACDHYLRVDDDLDLIADLGVNAYRFSISWSRVQPAGRGTWNEQGLDFYEGLVDGLLKRGVQPHVTLNHWDLPEALQAHGGWAARDTVHRFVAYARHINRRLGDRLASICTHNEPWVMSVLGHELGVFAPGQKCRTTSRQVAHHLLLSHGKALQAMRADGCSAKLGIVLNMSPAEPATDSAADAAQAVLDDAHGVRWYTDPLFKGHYPAEALADLGAHAPKVKSGDMRVISTPVDFLGVNYYTRHVASAGRPFDAQTSGLPLTEMGWEVYPQGLTQLLLRLHRDYTLPAVFITENGGAFKDLVQDGRVHDADRTAYLQSHIAAVAEALRQGVPMAGYMVWSLLDNFEWSSGYSKRFGIVHVDYATQKRTLKSSAVWYRQFLSQSRMALAA